MSTAWREGRRLYVRCGPASRLDTALRGLGAHWDGEQRALWAGAAKEAAVIEAVRAHEERKKAIQAVKDAGHWVYIPYAAQGIRAHARDVLRAVYGGRERKGWWAMRTAEDQADVTARVHAWCKDAEAARTAEAGARKERAAAERAQDAAEAEQAAYDRRTRILARSGRIATGETAELREISTRRMRAPTARGLARETGSLVRLADGRRGIVVDTAVWFTDDEMASSVCWHPETHDQAHWDFCYTVALVEPTGPEREQDAQEAAEDEDAAELSDLINAAASLTTPHCHGWTRVPEEEQAGQIKVVRGVTRFPAGTLTLMRDGRVIWQHPGYPDDYVHTEGSTSDAGVVARVRRLITLGKRERSWNPTGQQPEHFTVAVPEETV